MQPNQFEHKTPKAVRDNRRKSILDIARDGCAKLGGVATIDDRYSIVDTDKFNITPK